MFRPQDRLDGSVVQHDDEAERVRRRRRRSRCRWRCRRLPRTESGDACGSFDVVTARSLAVDAVGRGGDRGELRASDSCSSLLRLATSASIALYCAVYCARIASSRGVHAVLLRLHVRDAACSARSSRSSSRPFVGSRNCVSRSFTLAAMPRVSVRLPRGADRAAGDRDLQSFGVVLVAPVAVWPVPMKATPSSVPATSRPATDVGELPSRFDAPLPSTDHGRCRAVALRADREDAVVRRHHRARPDGLEVGGAVDLRLHARWPAPTRPNRCPTGS